MKAKPIDLEMRWLELTRDMAIAVLKADNKRLREVATKLNSYRLDQSYRCPWCDVDDDCTDEKHKPDCLGFMPDGVVK